MFLKLNKQTALLFAAPFLIYSQAQAYELDYKAFGSAYYGQAFSKDFLPPGFTDTNADFRHFGLVGSNISAKLNDQFTAAAQIVASGKPLPTSNYQFYSEWAYVAYTPHENTSIKIGRQRYPVFTASEFFNIGYELPMRAIPSLVFGVSPFVAFDGGSITQTFDLGVDKLSVEVFGGQPLLATTYPSYVTVNDTNLFGLRATLELDGLRLRAQASRGSVSIGINSTTPNATVENIYSVGYRFDKYNFVSWAEYVFTNAPNGSQIAGNQAIPPGLIPQLPAGVNANAGGKFLGKGQAGYVMAGYRVGDLLPRYTFSQINVAYGIANGKTTSHVVGLNYYAGKGAVVKAEVEFMSVPTPDGGYLVTQPIATAQGTSGSSFYLGVDFEFGPKS